MPANLKHRTGLGTGARAGMLLLGALAIAVAACGGDTEEAGKGGATEPAVTMDHSMPGKKDEAGDAGGMDHSMDTLPLPKRLAFMTGHVEAGLALYRAGEPEMAASHLLHPVSETHEAEREGLDALGFDGSLFEAVSRALEEGRPAAEIEPQLQAAEANLALIAGKAGGDPADIISYLMDTVVEEYTIAITDGAVSDPGEYQDAFGFTVVAKDRARSLEEPFRTNTVAALEVLLGFWPEAPVPPQDPAPVAQVTAQSAKVQMALTAP